MPQKHPDHRTRVTKMLIRRAFCELLGQKPVQSITIKELCERAGINRGTFYAHYKDIYDLMQKLEDDMLQDFRQALAPLLTCKTEDLTPLKITTSIFRCLQDNMDICTVTLGPYGDKDFAMRLINTGRERYIESYSKYFAGASAKQLEFYYAFVSGGCIFLLQKWLMEGMSSTAEEVAQTAEAIMLQGIGFLRTGASGAKE